MNLTLKPISPSAVPEALQKAERYRLLNEPWAAQSICEDILSVDSQNQQALTLLILAAADQIGDTVSESEVRQIASRLRSEYHQAYYNGIICERSAKATLRAAHPGCNASAGQSIQEAMRWFERAESLRPEGNDEAILRWNTCARMIMRNPALAQQPDARLEEVLGE